MTLSDELWQILRKHDIDMLGRDSMVSELIALIKRPERKNWSEDYGPSVHRATFSLSTSSTVSSHALEIDVFRGDNDGATAFMTDRQAEEIRDWLTQYSEYRKET